MTADLFDTIFDRIEKRIEPRVLAWLNKVRALLIEHGYTVNEPQNAHIDGYQWEMNTTDADGNWTEHSAGFTVELGTAAEMGDDEEFDGYGIAIHLVILGDGGLVLGEFRPYNFTGRCWVDGRDAAAVEERLRLLENADFSTLPELLASNGVRP